MKLTLHLAHGLKLICKNCVSEYRSMQMKVLRSNEKLTMIESFIASQRKSKQVAFDRKRYLVRKMTSLREAFKKYDMDAEQLGDNEEADANDRRKSISY